MIHNKQAYSLKEQRRRIATTNRDTPTWLRPRACGPCRRLSDLLPKPGCAPVLALKMEVQVNIWPITCMTKASFTAIHATTSAPFCTSSSYLSTYPGKCTLLHPGVNAPGTARMTPVLPLNRSCTLTLSVPSSLWLG